MTQTPVVQSNVPSQSASWLSTSLMNPTPTLGSLTPRYAHRPDGKTSSSAAYAWFASGRQEHVISNWAGTAEAIPISRLRSSHQPSYPPPHAQHIEYESNSEVSKPPQDDE